ncbi:MAG: hypothetical protein E7342_00355 [Clostridiales bacterium]|nr:hypothetical protein [Clostridiales bacterium]
MVIKIINKRVILPETNVFEGENGVDLISFEMDRFYDGVDLSSYDAYLKYVRCDGVSDKVLLNKKVEENVMYLEFKVVNRFTNLSGEVKIQLSFEKDDKIFNTELFYIDVKKSITGLEELDDPTKMQILEFYIKKSEFEEEREKIINAVSSSFTQLELKIEEGEIVAKKATNADSAVFDGENNEIAKTYQKKEDGKGLSTNDYTFSDKEKVDKIIVEGDGSKYLADDGSYKTAVSPDDILPQYSAGTGIKISEDIISLTSSATAKINTIVRNGDGKKYLTNDGKYKDIEYNAVVTFDGLTLGSHEVGKSWNEETSTGNSVGQWEQNAVTPVKIVKYDNKTVVQLMYEGAPYSGTRMFISDIAFSGPTTKGWISVKKNSIFNDAELFQILGWDGNVWNVIADLTDELNGLKDEKFYDLTFTFEDLNYAGIQILYRANKTSNELYIDTLRFKDVAESVVNGNEEDWKEVNIDKNSQSYSITLPKNVEKLYFEGFLFDDESNSKIPTENSTIYYFAPDILKVKNGYQIIKILKKEGQNDWVVQVVDAYVKVEYDYIKYSIKLSVNNDEKNLKAYYKTGETIIEEDYTEINGAWIFKELIYLAEFLEGVDRVDFNVDFSSNGQNYTKMSLLKEDDFGKITYGDSVVYRDKDKWENLSNKIIYVNSKINETEDGENFLEFMRINGVKIYD